MNNANKASAYRTNDKWLEAFILELRMQDVSGKVIGDAVASAQELLHDSGEQAYEMFGSPREYAASLALPKRQAPEWNRHGGIWPSMLGLLAFVVFNTSSTALLRGHDVMLTPVQVPLFAIPVMLVCTIPLYLGAIIRNRWILSAVLALGAFGAVFASLLTPKSPADAWLVIAPLPLVIIGGIGLIAVATWGTVMTRQEMSEHLIQDPITGKTAERRGESLTIRIVAFWMLPALSAVLFAVTMLNR
ncbi:hypothetical protein [Lysinibacter cavernae]|uniref:DUF1129 family protein n=1 Tax=Lysinibacter cavernae TaxID=1640652 RepID=A0A7X5TSA2_9MICO|nr:hypothetical protein [Lysinibacter cavernae]NIH53286.1 hypothetical protein [Lysinibacter cavernae]